jgi:hypothetical protein
VTTTLKAGFFFSLTDSNGEPRGTAYEILSITNSANFELTTYFEELSEAGVTYCVGQIPNIPEELHMSLAEGAIADFYGIKQKDIESATRFDNKFWTGSYNISPLQAQNLEGQKIGGLLGAVESYKDRDDSVIVSRNPRIRDIMDFQTPREFTG